MDGRHALKVREPLDRLPKVTVLPAKSPAEPADRPSERLGRGWAAVLGVGWPLALVIGAAVEPAPANPDAAVPVLVGVASMTLFVGLFVTIGAAMARNRVAATAGVVVGVIAVAFSAACPLTSHHGLGLWWVAQFGLAAGMLGATLGALRSSTRVKAAL